MANELEFYGDPNTETGGTYEAKVYNSSGSQVGADVALTEVGSLAIYQGNMPTASAGTYGIRFFDTADDTLLGQGIIYWDGTQEVDQSLISVIEGSVTLKQSLQLANAANAGKTAGMATTSATLRDLADTKNRIAATVDADGNRSAITVSYD